MKPTKLEPLRPSRRLFTVPACPRLRKLARLSQGAADALYIVACIGGVVLIARYIAIGLVPV